jgi:3-(3-hydroxy-phenyl)propionate hydroxylase
MTAHSSLYFNYQVYPVSPVPAAPQLTPVLVIGAGPVGLALAVLLARAGTRCVVVTAERQICEGSRAIVFTRRSLEILQQAGAHRAFEKLGLPWGCGNSFYRGHRVFRMETTPNAHDRFAPLTNLQQQFVEQALIVEAVKSPLISIRWGHRAISVADSGVNSAQAAIEIEAASEKYVQRAQYVVACDGARSSVRAGLGLKLEGNSYEGRFVIADIRIKLPLPTERLAFFDPVWNPGNTVLMHRQPMDMWRVDYQLPPGEAPEHALSTESLTTRINAQLDMIGHGGIPWELDWSSVYGARALTLPHYRYGRVLFAGDAAHMLPIFGVRGANTGFQDAQNLAWKLALVVQSRAPVALLESYSHERVAAAREIVEEAGKSTRFMAPPTRGFRLLRDAVLSLSLTQTFVRPLYHWRTSRSHAYLDSPLNTCTHDSTSDDNTAFAVGPACGESMANVALGPTDFLMDHFPVGFLLLATGTAAPADGVIPSGWEQALADFRASGNTITVQLHPEPAIQAQYGDGVYLVRPDQHIAARWLYKGQPLAAIRLSTALQHAIGK